MSVTLHCDAPDCVETVAAEPRLGRVSGPKGWWVMILGDSIIVACCAEHLLLVGKKEAA